jgi:hypothetical protein
MVLQGPAVYAGANKIDPNKTGALMESSDDALYTDFRMRQHRAARDVPILFGWIYAFHLEIMP